MKLHSHRKSLGSSMALMDNIKKGGKAFSLRDYMKNRKIAEHNEEVLDSCRKILFKEDPLAGQRVVRIKRLPNVVGEDGKKTNIQQYHLTGTGPVIGNLDAAREVAKNLGYTHYRMGVVFAKIK